MNKKKFKNNNKIFPFTNLTLTLLNLSMKVPLHLNILTELSNCPLNLDDNFHQLLTSNFNSLLLQHGNRDSLSLLTNLTKPK